MDCTTRSIMQPQTIQLSQPFKPICAHNSTLLTSDGGVSARTHIREGPVGVRSDGVDVRDVVGEGEQTHARLDVPQTDAAVPGA